MNVKELEDMLRRLAAETLENGDGNVYPDEQPILAEVCDYLEKQQQ